MLRRSLFKAVAALVGSTGIISADRLNEMDRPGGKQTGRKAFAPSFFGVPKNTVSQEIMDWWVRMMVDGFSLKTMNDLQKVFTETDFRPELRKISVPTLLIHGDNDASTPIEVTARKTMPLIQGCQLKVYEGASHGLPVTHADQLNADLLAFAKT